MRIPTLDHVTLSTGHTRPSPKHEVAPDIIVLLRAWLREGIAAGAQGVPVPLGLDEFSARVSGERGALLVTVYGQHPIGGPAPLLTLAVATDQPASDYLWGEITKASAGTPPNVVTHTPSIPWCAVRFEIGTALEADGQIPRTLPPLYEWAGDFERCVAWAWIEETQDEAARRN